MENVISLALPFFGLIFLGIAAGKLKKIPAEGLAWMQFFIIYIALPALFFRLLAKTPIEELTNIGYVAATTFATYCAFAVAFCVGVFASRGNIPEATIQALAGSYSNIGYMGPGLALLALGQDAAVPVALIFCFENILHFAIAPLMMGLAGGTDEPPLRIALGVVRKIALHPFILATVAGVGAAALDVSPPLPLERLLQYLANAAAPCALFVMGVTLALRPLTRMPAEIGVIVPLKLLVHPLICWVTLSWVGNFDPVWVWSAVLLAGLPTATNVFVIAQQYGVWVERASATILVTTTLSVLSVTGLLLLVTGGHLPADLFP